MCRELRGHSDRVVLPNRLEAHFVSPTLPSVSPDVELTDHVKCKATGCRHVQTHNGWPTAKARIVCESLRPAAGGRIWRVVRPKPYLWVCGSARPTTERNSLSNEPDPRTTPQTNNTEPYGISITCPFLNSPRLRGSCEPEQAMEVIPAQSRSKIRRDIIDHFVEQALLAREDFVDALLDRPNATVLEDTNFL